MNMRHFICALCMLAIPTMGFSWPFDNARSDYRMAVSEMKCCMALDATSQEASDAECPQLSKEPSLEELRADQLCKWKDKQSHSSGCDYEQVNSKVTNMRALCLQEYSEAECGDARQKGMLDASKSCGK